jgi:hypothetical protein
MEVDSRDIVHHGASNKPSRLSPDSGIRGKENEKDQKKISRPEKVETVVKLPNITLALG